MNPATKNVRYLLWEADVPHERWVSVLAAWVEQDQTRARELLAGGVLRLDEAERLADRSGRAVEDVLHVDFCDEVDILVRNLKLLFSELGHGGQRKLAAEIGVDETTISRWRGGRLKPSPTHLDRLAAHFHLSSGRLLAEEPLFLLGEPVTAAGRRRWLHDAVDGLESKVLAELYPALRRLLASDRNE